MSHPGGQPEWSRVVVNLAADGVHGRLAQSGFVERRFLYGGENALYQLAFAIAELGHEVELRGWLSEGDFNRFREQVGVAPRVGLEARRPRADDLVVVPEGWTNPLDYAALVLSPARLAMYVLAPPGLFGWPFTAEPWERPDPITVPLDAVARPEHFQGIAAVGFRLITHSPALAAAAQDAGVECSFIGEGAPGWRPPPHTDKSVDVVALVQNRWAPLADHVLAELGDLVIDRVQEVSNDEMIARMSRAHVLLWPSRIEGHAKIPWEARCAGCVPVALGSNRFAVGLDHEHGAVLVDTLEELGPAIRALLNDRPRLTRLAALGRQTAPAEADWDSFTTRVRSFLERPWPLVAGNSPLAGIGDALTAYLDRQEAEARDRLDEIAVAGEQLDKAGRLTLEKEWLERELQDVLARRSVRAALRLSRLLDRSG